MIYEYLCPNCKTMNEKYTFNYKLDKIKCNKCGKFAFRTISHTNFNFASLKFSREGTLNE